MKNKSLLFLIFLCTAIGLRAQNPFFEKFADDKEVTSVFISKRMFALIDNIDNENINLNGLAGKINEMYILTCETPAIINELRKEANSMVSKNNYEVLLRIKEGQVKTNIFLKEGKPNNEYILLSEEPKEFTFIMMYGKLTLKEIQNVIKDDSK